MGKEILRGTDLLIEMVLHDRDIIDVPDEFRPDKFQGRADILLVGGPVDQPLDRESDEYTQDYCQQVLEEGFYRFFHGAGSGMTSFSKAMLLRASRWSRRRESVL